MASQSPQYSTVKQKKLVMSIPGQLKMPVYHHHSPSDEFSLQFPQLILYSLERDYREIK